MRQQRYIGGPFHGQEKLLRGDAVPDDFLVLPIPHQPEPTEYAGYQLAQKDGGDYVYRFVGNMSRAELDWYGYFDNPAA